MRASWVFAVAFAGFSTPAVAATTVAVVPFSTTSGDEYHWIGSALAGALGTRLTTQPNLNAVTARQINAAVRSDNLEGENLSRPVALMKLGRLLGADLIVSGSYQATWPELELVLTTLKPSGDAEPKTYTIKGGLDELPQVELRVWRALMQELGVTDANPVVGAFGTQNLRAWRATTLAHQTLDWQSLGPQAADPKTPLALPKPAIEAARDLLVKATQYDDNYGDAWAALGITQALLGDAKAAWKAFGKATALGSGHHPTAVLGAAFLRMREGRFDEAAELLKGAVGRHPGFLHARGYLGELYNHTGRHQDALAVYDDYAKAAPQQPWVLAQRGYTKSKLGNTDGAVADSIAAVDLVPDSPSLLVQLASRYIDAKKLLGAEETLLEAQKLHPGETRIYVRLGYIYLLQEKDELAIPISEKALVQAKLTQNGRDRAYAHVNLARAYGHLGKVDKAFEHLKEAKAAGLASLGEVEGDPRLAGLRQDPRYKALAK